MTTIALNLTLTDPHDPKLTLTTNNLTLNNLRNVTYTKVANSATSKATRQRFMALGDRR